MMSPVALRRFLCFILTVGAIGLAPIAPPFRLAETGIAEARSRSVHVRGYYRKDGTYVQPHYRSAPDGNFYNNWSTKGNVNPYTGKPGTRVTPPSRYPAGSWGSARREESQTRELEAETKRLPEEADYVISRPTAPPPILALQVALLVVGQNPGRLDGVEGPQTAMAFEAYRASKPNLSGGTRREALKQLALDALREGPYGPGMVPTCDVICKLADESDE